MIAVICLCVPSVIVVLISNRLTERHDNKLYNIIRFLICATVLNGVIWLIVRLFFHCGVGFIYNLNHIPLFALKYIALAIVLAAVIVIIEPAAENWIVKSYRKIEGKSRKLLIITGIVFFCICAVRFLVLADDYLTVSTKTNQTDFLPEIVEGDEYTQIIHCKQNYLDTIKIFYAIFDRTNHSETTFELSDDTGVIQTWILDDKLLSDNASFSLKLDKKQKNSEGKDYILRVTSNAEPGEGITLYTTNKKKYSGLSYNLGETDRSLSYQLVYKYPVSELWSGEANAFHLDISFFIAIALLLILPLISTLPAEKLVMIVWIPVCCLYLCSGTIFNAPDEEAHFLRSLEISSGHFISELNETEDQAGNYLPMVHVYLEDLEADWESFSENSDMVLSDDQDFAVFDNTALYSPVSYLPQALGMFIARLFTKNVSAIAYAGRIANLIAITVLMYFTLKLLPGKAKVIMGLIFLIPMNAYEAVSLAPDALVTALAAFMIAFVIYISFIQEGSVKKSQIVLLYILAIAVSQMKIVYLPFILVYFLIPGEKLGGGKYKAIHAVLVAVISASLSLGWLGLAGQFLLHQGANSSMQIQTILMHPFNFMLIMARTVFELADYWITTMMGSSLNELNVDASAFLMLIYAGMLLLAYCRNWSLKDWSVKKNGVFILITGFTSTLIMASLYIQWTPVANTTIYGIQGRYFLPLLLPVYYAVNPIDLNENSSSIGCSKMYIVTGINICACLSILFESLAGI